MTVISFGVRTPLRLVRVKLDDSETIGKVKQEVAKDINVEAKYQTISLTPGGDAEVADSTILSALGIAGKLLYCVLPKGVGVPAASKTAAPAGAGAGAGAGASPAAVSPAPAPAPRKLTSRCEHGPQGACQYCLPASDEDFEKRKAEPLNRAVAFNTKAAEMSKATVGGEPEELEWLCRHRPDQMCLNCAPLRKGEKVELEMLCQHAPEARCINCLPPDTTIEGRKFLSYGEWLEQAKAKCSHPFGATCVNCAPPSEHRFKLKPGCGRHKPFPGGICFECAPETVDLSEQKYRHVDQVVLNCVGDLRSFIDVVSLNERANFQRAGVLYGRYAPDPNFRHGTQAIVEAIYEPPQLVDHATGAVRVLADPHERAVAAVAAACGLQPVGWLFSRKRTSEAKGVELLPHELYAVAGQQLQHSPRVTDGRPGSQWVTVTVAKSPKDGMYHLQGYMASDQLMALVRDGVLAQPKADDVKFKRRELRKDASGATAYGEMPVPDIVAKSKDRGAYRTESFDPDVCLLTMEASGPTPGSLTGKAFPPMFKHEADFPAENREALGQKQTTSHLKRLLTEFKAEPSQSRISSFHALVYLAVLTDVETAVSAARSVVEGRPLEEGVQVLLEAL